MDSTQSTIEQEDDRRRYFRIDDSIGLVLRMLDHRRVDEEIAQFDKRRESICFMNSVEIEREQHLPQMRSIQQNHPDIAGYIGYLESRIDVLATILSERDIQETVETQKVNISAQGIRFYSWQAFGADDLVELRITLMPKRKRLLLIGTVVWCVEDPKALGKNKYAVAVDFTYIHEVDREVLVKHIHEKQMAGLGNSRESKPDE